VTRTARELALLRLVAQGLAGPRLDSPLAVAERLLCLQAQDYWSGLASVAVRSGCGLAEVEAAFDAGSIVRAWPLRGTLHLLAAQDLGWLRELLAPRQLAGAALREQRLGLDTELIARATDVVIATLTAAGPSSRAELNRAWAQAGLDSSGQRSYHLIWHLAHAGTIVLGPTRGGQQLFALTEQWIGAAGVVGAAGEAGEAGSGGLTREAALELLARRYFSGHGPATAADLTRWANLTAADTRQAITAARRSLRVLSVDGVEYLLAPNTEDLLAACRGQAGEVLALPHFDELLLGYRNRNPTLPPARDIDVFANRNGVPARTIVHRGQVIATWKRPKRGSGAAVEVTPLVTATAAVVARAAARAAEISGRNDVQ
jgi:Winged helix DNA-binding domain